MDVKAVRPPGPLLPAGVRLLADAPVAQKSDALATDDDGKKSVVPATSAPPSVGPFDGLTSDQIFEVYAATMRRGGQRPRNKHFQDSIVNATIQSAAASVFDSMCIIAQGTGSNGARLGLQVRVKSLVLRGIVEWWNTATNPTVNVGVITQFPPVRFVIFYDRMPAVGSPIWAENSSPATGNAAIVNTLGNGQAYNSTAPWNINTHGVRYHILYDKIIKPHSFLSSFNGSSVAASATTNFEVNMHMDHMISWYNTSGTAWIDGTIGFFVMCDIPVATWQQNPIFSGQWSLEFDDVTVN